MKIYFHVLIIFPFTSYECFKYLKTIFITKSMLILILKWKTITVYLRVYFLDFTLKEQKHRRPCCVIQVQTHIYEIMKRNNIICKFTPSSLFLDPPNITVTATNTSVKATTVILTCNAYGEPNNYTYGKWVHTWPGHSIPLSKRPGIQTLQLTHLTYEHSGVYTCSASNGIKEFGTNKEYIEGSARVLVKCKC